MVRFCKKTGCGNIIAYDEKYCEKHKDLEKKRYKEYNRLRRDNSEERKILNFYCSGPWLSVRDTMYSRYKGMCVICWLKDNNIVDADVVHHIEEIRDNWRLRLRLSNLICLCNSCHTKVHNEYKKCEESKLVMQDILRGLIIEFNKEYRS